MAGVLGEGGVGIVGSTSATDEVAAEAGGSLATHRYKQRRLACQSSWLGTFLDMDSSTASLRCILDASSKLLDGATVNHIHQDCSLSGVMDSSHPYSKNGLDTLDVADIISGVVLMDSARRS
jgi:hypothetical protein